MFRSFTLIIPLLLAIFSLTSCGDATAPVTTANGKTEITLALNWVPEPEFGGFYAAQEIGAYSDNNLAVTIKPGGAGSPVIQMLAAGRVPFGIVSADEVVIARSRGQKIVALYTSYETCPQGIMVHKDRGIDSLEQLFKTPGTIAMEPGLPYGKFLMKKHPPTSDVKIVPYTGGVAQFLNDKTYSQQGFIFSEPILAKKNGADPHFFLLAETGYNPYTVVVATTEEYLVANPMIVKAFVKAVRAGWASYLKDPAPANAVMGQLNTNMDQSTFAAAAEAQAGLVSDGKSPLGNMSADRWEELGRQLVDLGIIDVAPPAQACFVNLLDE